MKRQTRKEPWVYNYETEKPKLFTEENQLLFLGIRDRVQELLKKSGAVMQGCVGLPSGVGAADSWTMLACFDRLVELGELEEITRKCAGQHRVFIAKR